MVLVVGGTPETACGFECRSSDHESVDSTDPRPPASVPAHSPASSSGSASAACIVEIWCEIEAVESSERTLMPHVKTPVGASTAWGPPRV